VALVLRDCIVGRSSDKQMTYHREPVFIHPGHPQPQPPTPNLQPHPKTPPTPISQLKTPPQPPPQLRQWGWVHHLARHSVACFLTRGDLYLSWEAGQEVFEELLLDAVRLGGGCGVGACVLLRLRLV